MGYPTSPQPGFVDAIVLILVLFVALYGFQNARPTVAPISLPLILAGITTLVSNENA